MKTKSKNIRIKVKAKTCTNAMLVGRLKLLMKNYLAEIDTCTKAKRKALKEKNHLHAQYIAGQHNKLIDTIWHIRAILTCN